MSKLEIENAYILGTDDEELRRLGFQHSVWSGQAHELWRAAGLKPGDRVLDLGCGPGFISVELARFVGPTGRVLAHDRSPRFLRFLESECFRLGLANVETLLGEAESLSLPDRSIDACYARWLFCWLADPYAVLKSVAQALKPGGAILLQDYLDWGAMKAIPPSDNYMRARRACMESWRLGGGTINICEQVPALARRAGLTVELFHPVARLGAEPSPEWRWVIGFLHHYLPSTIEKGIYTQADFDAFRAEFPWPPADSGSRFVYTPTVADVVLRKP